MLTILRTLARGSVARANERLADEFAVELIDQKVREAEAGLAAAKDTLATLIVRLKRERAALADRRKRKGDLEARTLSAMERGDDDLARSGADLIAELEGEETARAHTVSRLETRTGQLRLSIERAHRRVVSLRQGAMTARSIDRERTAQRRLGKHFAQPDPEAEELIRRVMEADDPFERAEVRREIDAELRGDAIMERLGERGHGAPTRSNADTVLDRLRAKRETA